MIISPIIPIWIMLIICIGLILIRPKNKNRWIRQIIMVALIFCINLRIMVPGEATIQTMSSDLDVIFVIDNTISMLAEDYSGNKTRLSAVKQDCEKIVDELNGARFSVITFNNESKILMPFTKDSNMVIESIDIINVTDELYAKGSSLNVVLEDMVNMLKTAEKQSGRKTILFFISDGEITNEDTLKSFKEAEKYIENGAVLGYGTEQGGYMKIKDRYTEVEKYLEDKTEYPYQRAVSKMDKNNLNKIAKDMGIDYISMEKQSNITNKLAEIRAQAESESLGEDITQSYTDTYYLFVIPLCGLLIIELVIYKRKL